SCHYGPPRAPRGRARRGGNRESRHAAACRSRERLLPWSGKRSEQGPAATSSGISFDGRGRRGDSDYGDAGGNQDDAGPALERDVFAEEPSPGEGGENVSDGSDGQDVTEIGPAQKSHVARSPCDEQGDADRDPGMEKRADQGERRIAGIADLLHAFGESGVSGDVGEDDDGREQTGFGS